MIDVTIDINGNLQDVRFAGGCSGNAQGLSALIKGMPVAEAIRRLKGIQCGRKATSCPDQLALALEQAALIDT